MKKPALTLLALALCSATMAQSVIGSVTSVQGLVTMSDATSVSTVVPGTPVLDGARFVASSSGSASLLVNDDCRIDLKPNESVTVDQNKTCPQMLAAVQMLGGPGTTVVASGNSGLLQVLGAAGVAALLVNNKGSSNPPISGQ